MQKTAGVTAVIGAGIIGVSIAYALRRRGRAVMLIERGEPGRATSFGNMASIAVTQFAPISRPANWSRMPRWLLDPEGPIRIAPSYLPRMLPWFLRFVLAGRPARVDALERAGAALCQRVHADLGSLLAETGLSHLLSDAGCLSVYMDDAELAADREQIDLIRRFGFDMEVLDSAAVRRLEPALSHDIRHALLLPQGRTIRDPFELTTQLHERFLQAGGQALTGEVVAFGHRDGGADTLILADGRRVAVAEVVLAAGAWTGKLSRQLGEPIPLETERGYHTQFTAPGVTMRHSLLRPARAFMLCPIAGGIRVGGTVELAGLEAPPNYRRARVLAKRAKEMLPALQTAELSEWMGHRPALPDTIPIISRSARQANVFYATGHGHLGVTLAATTARLIADLVTGVTPPVDISPYRIDRF